MPHKPFKARSSFKEPNPNDWFVLPFIILLIIGYLLGFKYVYRNVMDGGYKYNYTENSSGYKFTYNDYDYVCKFNNIINCLNQPNSNYNDCLNKDMSAKCENQSYTHRTGWLMPILIYLIVPFVVALIMSVMLYVTIYFLTMIFN